MKQQDLQPIVAKVFDDSLAKRWVLMDSQEKIPTRILYRYVSTWPEGAGPNYTNNLKDAMSFEWFSLAMQFLITRTFSSGKAYGTYNSTLVPARIEEVVSYAAVSITDIVKERIS